MALSKVAQPESFRNSFVNSNKHLSDHCDPIQDLRGVFFSQPIEILGNVCGMGVEN